MPISVLIMTLNEEDSLPACLASLTWCDDIVVLDSFSTDRTVEIAKEAGARVYQHKYETETRQRMYGLKEIEFKHKWVYMPDADEITPDDLRDEMLAIAADPDRPEAMFSARYKNMFMGRWIKHSSLYPTWITRLCRPERIHYERECHSRPVGDGPTGRLRSHFVHYSFNKGMTAWFDKHNRYSGFEARESLQILRSKRIPWTGFFSATPEARRRALKEFSYRLPFRPAARFAYMYFLRGGFLDGWQGYHYCRLIASYEYMIVIKMRELQRRELGLSI
ncbi:glycosyltransferase family 2 protein [Phyllobacterium sophorae]|uniref:Glycosyltransferase family 2 protein n=1 Tax=Phyllobacterium sophorae TaxID=1520277 RepID=A0A2P7BM06_9HYPH|nr:glycosyltransferase family 2 protein [Phyllobacterium sophorae]